MTDFHDLERRAIAVRKTRDYWAGKPHDWKRVDCARVAIRHLREMGHRPGPLLSKAGPYGSALGAKRALARAGFASITEALDSLGLPRISAASALPGDLFIFSGTEGLDAVTVWIGNMAMLGFHETAMSSGLCVMRLHTLAGVEAWRL